jgi:probable rRNA maturation factor
LVYLENRTRGTGLDTRALVRVLERLLAEIGERGTSVSLTFVRDPAMRELNREHRGKDAPTDVLSFPIYAPEAFDRSGLTRPRARGDVLPLSPSKGQDDVGPERMLGDIVVSVDTAQRQAEDYGATLEREIQRLLIHGVLHLAGHDHVEPGERAVMEAEERRLADSVGMPWPYHEPVAR